MLRCSYDVQVPVNAELAHAEADKNGADDDKETQSTRACIFAAGPAEHFRLV